MKNPEKARAPGRHRAVAALFLALACGGAAAACNAVLGVDGFRAGQCDEGDMQCAGDAPQICHAGQWEDLPPCDLGTCPDLECTKVCVAGETTCFGDTPKVCVAGVWTGTASCDEGLHCSMGQCVTACGKDDVRCVDNTPESCASGDWQALAGGKCQDLTCVNGLCAGECAPGKGECSGDVPKTCDAQGKWEMRPACAPGTCKGGTCLGPSCDPDLLCGQGGQAESCCASPLVHGGTFDRDHNPAYPATISDFRLDRFETTVGRMRRFLDFLAQNPTWTPAPGAGAHPKLGAASGWRPEWEGSGYPIGYEAMKTYLATCPWSGTPTWTEQPGANEDRPITCVNWFVAFGFCTWDGGRLPTEAEWAYAAAGGDEQRLYPWSYPPSSKTIDDNHAVYNCNNICSAGEGCGPCPAHPVGWVSPAGDGRWRHADLAGNAREWVLDEWSEPYADPNCINCANTQFATDRPIRGGSYDLGPDDLLASARKPYPPNKTFTDQGFRCARAP
jgi:sulfatase modifying factor 1